MSSVVSKASVPVMHARAFALNWLMTSMRWLHAWSGYVFLGRSSQTLHTLRP